MPRPEPASGTTDSAQGFQKAEKAWNAFRNWVFDGPQHAWVKIHGQITLLRRAQR